MNKETKLQNSTQTEEWQKYSKNRQKTTKEKVRCVYLKNCTRASLFYSKNITSGK